MRYVAGFKIAAVTRVFHVCASPKLIVRCNLYRHCRLANPHSGGAVAEWVRIPLRKTFRFGTLAIPFTPLCQCLSEETLKAVGPFYLVPMPGEVKDPTSPHWNV